jgi:hypothetical protein
MPNNTDTLSINDRTSAGDANAGVPKGHFNSDAFPAKPSLTSGARIYILTLSITCLTTSLSQLPLSPYPESSRVLLSISIFTTVAGCIACMLVTMREQPTAFSNPTFPYTIALATLLVFHFTFALAMMLDDYRHREMALVILICAGMELGAVGVLIVQGWSAWGLDRNADVEAASCGGKKELK